MIFKSFPALLCVVAYDISQFYLLEIIEIMQVLSGPIWDLKC